MTSTTIQTLWPSKIRDTLLDRTDRSEQSYERVLRIYETAPWREPALKILNVNNFTDAELIYEPNKFMKLVYGETTFKNPEKFKEIIFNEDKSLVLMLLVEWHFGMFSTTLNEENWLSIVRPIENYWDAKRYLKKLILDTAKDNEFKQNYREFCSGVFTKSAADPAGFWPDDRVEKQKLVQLINNWKQKPTLSKLWRAEREIDHLFPFSGDLKLIEFMIALDVKFAVQLLESFENPYQPMAIMSYQLHLASDYETWEKLFVASPALFTADGKWTGCCLPALLYTFLEDALSRHYLHGLDDRPETTQISEPIDQLCTQISQLVEKREDAVHFSYFLTSELFGKLLQILDHENKIFPTDDSPAWPIWKLITAIAELGISKEWPKIEVLPSLHADRLCQLAVVMIAENNRDLPISGIQEIFELFPSKPEDLYDGSISSDKTEISQFTILSRRSGAFGYRIVSMAFSHPSRAENFKLLWEKAQTAREIVEFGNAGFSSRDNAFEAICLASDLISLVIGLGLSLIDHCMDSRIDISTTSREKEAASLFQQVSSAILEMGCIRHSGIKNYSSMISYLINLRAISWERHPRNNEVAIQLSAEVNPSIQQMLASQRKVSNDFFQIICSLINNGLDYQRLCAVCLYESEYKFDLDEYRLSAERLNSVDANRKIDLSFLR